MADRFLLDSLVALNPTRSVNSRVQRWSSKNDRRRTRNQELFPRYLDAGWVAGFLHGRLGRVVGFVVTFDRCRVVDGVFDAVQIATDGFRCEEGSHDGDDGQQ